MEAFQVDPLGRRPPGACRASPRARSPGCAARIRSTASRSIAVGRLALSVARRNLCEGCAGRAHRLGRGDRGSVNDQGRREVGQAIGASEAEAFWTEFLRSHGPARAAWRARLLISDDHKGRSEGRRDPDPRRHLANRVPFARNLLAHAGRQGRRVERPPSSPPPSPRRTPTARRPSGVTGRRPAQAQGAQAGSSHGRSRARRPRLHDFPQGASARNCTPQTRSNGSMPRSSAAPTSSASFPTTAITRLVGAILLEQNDEPRLKEIVMTLESIAPLSDGVITLPTVAA